jgi:hypothetical protein
MRHNFSPEQQTKRTKSECVSRVFSKDCDGHRQPVQLTEPARPLQISRGGDRAGVSVMISPHPGCRVRYYGALLLENRCENRRELEHHNEQVSTVVTRLTRTWDVPFCSTYQLQWLKLRFFLHSFLKLPNLCWKFETYYVFLTFRGRRIVIYSYNKTNETHYFLEFIFGIELYVFRRVPLSIIGSLALYAQQ